jgi:hypothetical protein
MTTQQHGAMAANQRLATLSDLLPDTASPRHGWRALIARFSRRRPRGLAAIPERYRLQFLVLAAEAMPGRPQADVAAMAGRLADRTRIPARLLAKLPDHAEMDEWFRDSCERITGCLGELLEKETAS